MKDVALWINDAILLGTAILVWRYVVATNKLVQNSQQQIHAAQGQIESQAKLAVTARSQGGTIWLVNMGNGPAVYI
jgi:hypothetical protein